MHFKVDTYTFQLLIFTTLKYSIPMIHDPHHGQKHRDDVKDISFFSKQITMKNMSLISCNHSQCPRI
jgi:hypothetical protein